MSFKLDQTKWPLPVEKFGFHLAFSLKKVTSNPFILYPIRINSQIDMTGASADISFDSEGNVSEEELLNFSAANGGSAYVERIYNQGWMSRIFGIEFAEAVGNGGRIVNNNVVERDSQGQIVIRTMPTFEGYLNNSALSLPVLSVFAMDNSSADLISDVNANNYFFVSTSNAFVETTSGGFLEFSLPVKVNVNSTLSEMHFLPDIDGTRVSGEGIIQVFRSGVTSSNGPLALSPVVESELSFSRICGNGTRFLALFASPVPLINRRHEVSDYFEKNYKRI